MPAYQTKPTARLLRAAHAEQQEIARRRARLQAKREHISADLAQIDRSLAELDERANLLSRLARPELQAVDPNRETSEKPRVLRLPTTSAHQPSTDAALRGPAIRETAVALAAQAHRHALHYRDWFSLLTDAGYQVAGKDPLAVFLTQISRSPLVRKGTQAGVYEIDQDAPRRLTRRLTTLQARLRDTASQSTQTPDAPIQREQLITEIRHTERALREAQRVLAADSPRAGRAAG